jgi:uncharacterized membrane protein
MLPYGLLGLVASVVLALHHVAITDASRRSKLAVSIVVAASLAIWWNYYQWQWRVLVIVLQVSVSIYTLVYLKMSASRAEKS